MALNIQPPQPSVSERRGQRLAPLQTNFSRPTPALRQPTVLAPAPRPQRLRPSEANDQRAPLQSPAVMRQSSKSGLRSLFGRDKSSRKSNHDSKLAEIGEGQIVGQPGESVLDAPILSPSVCATPKTAVSTPTLVASPTVDARPKTQSQPRATKAGEERPVPDPSWKPPPLFQAYPQSLKHATLAAPALSADSILRMNATNKSSRDEDSSSQTQGSDSDVAAARKKKEHKERKHLRSLSETIGKTDWTQKIYVLATSGYVLQYAGEGKHDRLPEKMLQLGPKSVAFASDAIPGKHWVLQVSQSSEEESITVEAPKPLFSRLGFHRSHTRRLTRSFLLVFNTPEELSTWLLAVRAEIEARGGKKYVSERVFDDGMEHQLRPKPSVRQMVKRDPNRFSNSFLQPQNAPDEDPNSRRSSYISVNRRSIVNQPTDSRSGSFSTAQTEITPPVTSPTGTGRFYSSLSAAGSSSQVAGTPAPAPAPAGAPPPTQAPTLPRLDPQSPPVSSPRKRQSMYMYIPKQSPTPPIDAAKLPRSQSTVPEPFARSASPPAPNFSVPSFSKRFAAKSPPLKIPNLQKRIHPSLQDYDDDDDDANVDAIASFPSPPQSPNRSISSMSRKNSCDQSITSPSREAVKRPIRVNSEDSLVDSQREPKYQPFPRIKSVTPLSLPRLTTDTEPNQSPDAPQRGRTSVLYTPIPPKMSHRKSMPGLQGPPSAPPPSIPLPKIPSPVDPAASEQWEAPRDCKSPPLRTRERRKSSASSQPRSVLARQNLINRI